MSAIVTLTVNPTIDKSTSIDALMPEKKLRCSEPVSEPGGGGINVARAIKKLGGESLAMFLAGGYNGELLQRLLAAEGVPAQAVSIKDDTRENIIVLDSATNQQYRFGMPGPKVEEEEWKKCLQLVENAGTAEFIVASGSLSPGIPKDFFARLARIARKNGAKLIVDTSGEALKLAVGEGIYLVKPNLAELASLAGKEDLDHEDIVEAARSIISRGGCEVVIVSMGPSGAMLISEDRALHLTAPSVRKRSTVGAGDSMVAGIVLALSRGTPLDEAARFGVACGTAATMNPGTQLCTKADAERLNRMVSVAEIP